MIKPANSIIVSLITFSVLLLFCVQFTSGIKCWECDSARDENCLDPFKSSKFEITDCDVKYSHQSQNVRACQRVAELRYGKLRITRSCMSTALNARVGIGGDNTYGPGTNCDHKTLIGFSSDDCWCNDKDGCNDLGTNLSLGTLTSSPLPILLILTLSLTTVAYQFL